jgi:flagellar FliL protein
MPPEEEQKVQEKPKSNKLLIIIVLLTVVLGAGGAGAYFTLFKTSTEKAGDKKEAERAAVFYEMETFMVNLSDPGGKHFLKATVKFKVSSTGVLEECGARNFELRDLVLMVLSGKETQEIASTEDKLALKKQLMETVNHVLRKGQVLEIYFTEFLVQ